MTVRTIETVLLEFVRTRVTSNLPAQIRACVEELTEEQLWWRPNDSSNSVGNLVLHVSGSTRHYLCRLGGFEYQRDRAAEFSNRGPIPKQELLALFDETVRQARATLDALEPGVLLNATEEPGYYGTLADQLLGVMVHLATHAGQIIFVTKLLKEGSVDELWIRTHKAQRS